MKLWRLIISAILVVLISIAYIPVLKIKVNKSLIMEEEADLLVKNGTIYTSDISLPFAECLAIRNSRVLRIGNCASLQDLIGQGTKELNLNGKIVVPGFIDSHVHLIYGGLQMARVELHGINKKEDFVKKVKEAIKDMKDGSWLQGHGWNNDLWGGDLPTVSWIDEITPNNPVWLTRMDGHMGLANTLALKISKITSSTKASDSGTIIKDNNGDPTGVLIDSAMKLINSYIPEVSIQERKDAFLRASNYALTRGITTMVDLGRYFPGASPELSWEDFSDIYKWADLSKKMKIRLCLFFPMEKWEKLHELINKEGRKLSEWIYLGGVKAFSDGSLGSNSALFIEPYVDEPDNYGLQVSNMDDLYNMTLLADKHELQVAIHAIGDKANDLILDMYDSVASKNGPRDRRFRIEHAQHLAQGAVAKFGKQDVLASVQPDHLLDDADSAIKKLGPERAYSESYLFKSLLSNTQLAFGSDWPVADINPLHSIKTAINRIPPGWDKPWIGSERVTLNEALNAYTISAAYACFLEKEIGSLSKGKLADFVVLSSESWDDFAKGESVSVEATYVGGVHAYQSKLVHDI